MPKGISTRPRLLIVSDTAMWKVSEQVFAYEPVLREIENYGHIFSKITWIGYGFGSVPVRKSARPTAQVEIEYVLLPAIGGNKLSDKVNILLAFLGYFKTIKNHLKNADLVHSRGPSLPAFCAILISLFDRRRKYWHKYAGNWASKERHYSYRLQRYLLKLATNSIVTVNGKWDNQPQHIRCFENPCLTKYEYDQACGATVHKDFTKSLNLCFVGALNENKGIINLIKALAELKSHNIKRLVVVGDGILREQVELESDKINHIDIQITGYLDKKNIFKIYEQSHCLVLPSKSEGFPKVISEAAAYGCIPVVTRISCIDQYIINEQNGFLLENNSVKTIRSTLYKINDLRAQLPRISKNAQKLPEKFTYEYYNARIRREIMNNHT